MTTAPRQEINLYTLDFHRSDQVFSFVFITRCCLALLLALMAFEAYTGWRLWSQEQHLAELNNLQRQVSTRLFALKQTQPLSQRPKLEKELNHLQMQVLQRQELQKIMGGQEFGNFDGFSDHLMGLARQTNKDISLSHIQLLNGGSILQLQGWTRLPEAVPRYLQNLRDEESLEETRFGVLEIEQDPQYQHKLRFVLGFAQGEGT